MRAHHRQGFTLIEIMIVAAIIALLGALSIPNLLRARLVANESSAIAALRTISSAAHTYRASNPTYPANLSDLHDTLVPPYIDIILAGGIKNGYRYNLTGTDVDLNGHYQGFLAQAEPFTVGFTGKRFFAVDTSAVLRYGDTADDAITGTPVD